MKSIQKKCLLVFFTACLVLFSGAIAGFSQTSPTSTPTVERFGALGIGYFSQAAPQFQGWGALALPLTSDGKAFSYTDFDVAVVPGAGQISVAGLQLRYTMRTGVAYRIYSYGSWSLFGLAAPGFAATGNEFQSAFEYGGFISKKLGKNIGSLLGLTNEHYGAVSDLAPRAGIIIKF